MLQRRGELVIGLWGWNAAGPIFGTGWEIRVGTKDPELLHFYYIYRLETSDSELPGIGYYL